MLSLPRATLVTQAADVHPVNLGSRAACSHSSSSSGHQTRAVPVASAVLVPLLVVASKNQRRQKVLRRAQSKSALDDLITTGVKGIEALELSRVKAQSEVPSEANGNWSGEPKAWAEDRSLVQQVSSVSQVGVFAQAKQFIAERLAGDYDRESIRSLIKDKISTNKVMMFSFSSCPFCLRAKDLLRDVYGEEIVVYECDLESEGKAVRAELGLMTGRTSMPSTWLGPDVLLGGCNDGGLGGVATLHRQGKLGDLLATREAEMGGIFSPILQLFAALSGNQKLLTMQKGSICAKCLSGPKNGVGASQTLQEEIEAMAMELQKSCPSAPARMPLSGVWDLLYCTAQGASSGKLGPLVGNVTQTFVDDVKFVNAVEFLGVLKVALQAEREVIDENSIRVSFKKTVFSILGQEVFSTPSTGSGVWEQRYVDSDLRIMNTPSVFVLRRRSGS